jgi:small subunit ribosomal protein S16
LTVKGKFIEIIGNYNPTLKPKTIVINKEKALHWISQGAQVSDTVKNLMCDLGILDKSQKVKKIYAKKVEKETAEKPATPATETTAAETQTETESESNAASAGNTETPAEEPTETKE